MSDSAPKSVSQLAGKYIDGTLSKEEADYLHFLMETDPQIERHLVGSVLSHLVLLENFDGPNQKETFISSKIKTKEISVWEETHQEENLPFLNNQDPRTNVPLRVQNPIEKNTDGSFYWTGDQEDRSNVRPERNRRSRRRKFFLLASGILLIVLLLFGWIFWNHQQSGEIPYCPIARVVETVDPVWREGQMSYKNGQGVERSNISLKSGLVRLKFENGVELILEGPLEFAIKDSAQTFCSEGRVSALVPSSAAGFEVSTPYASVIDRGTAFFLEVDQKKARVDVIKGKVDFVPPNKSPVPLNKGKAYTIDHLHAASEQIAQPERYMDTNKFRTILNQSETRMLESIKLKQASILRDSSLMLHWDLREGIGKIESGQIRGCRESQGRFQQTRSIAFNRRTDRLFWEQQGSCSSLTLMTSVRIDHFQNQTNVLFCSGGFAAGEGNLLWQILKDGRLQLQITHQNPKGDLSGKISREEFYSPAVYNRSTLGTWITLAVVLDSEKKTVSMYADGQEIAKKDWTNAVPLKFKGGTIGNYESNDVQRNARNLNGAMEEFLIFRRPLSSKEIFR
ncbi:MAG: LamG-like jellyroll fold domain-containing protein [Planctomycetia bacterium]|nr:LamG-like jellyroll fold domain-containing protein [Planctomycetia bacterium]